MGEEDAERSTIVQKIAKRNNKKEKEYLLGLAFALRSAPKLLPELFDALGGVLKLDDDAARLCALLAMSELCSTGCRAGFTACCSPSNCMLAQQ